VVAVWQQLVEEAADPVLQANFFFQTGEEKREGG